MSTRKNPAAVALGKRRAEGADMAELGRKGGLKRSRKKRCPCGEMTLKRAKARGHKCEATIESEFRALANAWRKDTRHLSSVTKMAAHPAYQRIIAMGRDVLPLLFKELSKRPDHWLVALVAITGEDPAPEGCAFNEAVEAWLEWGRAAGYLPLRTEAEIQAVSEEIRKAVGAKFPIKQSFRLPPKESV